MDAVNFLKIVHHHERPNAKYYIENLFPDFIELGGDRLYGDDPSVIGGIVTIEGDTGYNHWSTERTYNRRTNKI